MPVMTAQNILTGTIGMGHETKHITVNVTDTGDIFE
jgi:hypothetical protein